MTLKIILVRKNRNQTHVFNETNIYFLKSIHVKKIQECVYIYIINTLGTFGNLQFNYIHAFT